MRLPYVYKFLFLPLKSELKGLLLLLRLRLVVERLLDDLLEDVLLEDFDGVLLALVFFVVDVFFLLLFSEPKSKLMVYLWGQIVLVASCKWRVAREFCEPLAFLATRCIASRNSS